MDKFGRQNDLSALEVVAGQQEILVSDGSQSLEGSRDKLLAAMHSPDVRRSVAASVLAVAILWSTASRFVVCHLLSVGRPV